MSKRPPSFSPRPATARQWVKSVKEAQDRNRYGTAWRKLRLVVLERDRRLCQTCLKLGRTVAATDVDHILPIAQGGTNDLANLQCLCSDCHRTKSALEGQYGRWRRAQVVPGKVIYHQRPAWFRRTVIPLTIVCGPPGSGKSTYVARHAGRRDLVICFDQIATRLFGRKGSRRVHARLTKDQLGLVLRARNEMLADLMHDHAADRWRRAWLIVSEPKAEHRQWWHDRTGADIVVMATAHDECLRRISADAAKGDARDKAITGVVAKWFALYQPRLGDLVVAN